MSLDLQPTEANAAFLAEVMDGLYSCISVRKAIRHEGKIVDFECVYVNRAYTETFHTSREQMLGQRLLSRFPSFRETGLVNQFVEVVETGKPLDIEQHIQGDGLNLHIRHIIKKFGDGYLAAFHDIARRKRGETELKLLNRELENRVAERTAELSEAQRRLQQALTVAQESNRAKSEFLAMVSHDLRSPLAAIQDYVSLLSSEGVTQEQAEPLKIINRCAGGLLRLLDDLLHFSRLEAGQFKLKNEAFALPELFDETLGIFRPAAMHKKIGLRIAVREKLPEMVVGDSAQLRRILANLVGNAVKFTEQGEVVIRVQADSPPPPDQGFMLKVKVIDQGEGLDPGQARRLFRPYFQGEDGLRHATTSGGVGLGLAICRHLCDLMGGDIDYQRTPDTGSCFSFQVKLGAVNEN